MARTPIAAALSRIVSSVAGSMQGEPGTPAAGPARRTVLKGAGALAAGLAVPAVTASPATRLPHVVVPRHGSSWAEPGWPV